LATELTLKFSVTQMRQSNYWLINVDRSWYNNNSERNRICWRV